MPRGQNLNQARLSKEERLRYLGNEPLQPDEVSISVRVRLKKDQLPGVLRLTAKQRGELLAKGLEEVQDG